MVLGSEIIGKILGVCRQIPIIPLIILPIFLICGIFGNVIAPHDPIEINLMDARTPPFWQKGGNTKFLLGTDKYGRDILSRLIVGAGISLQVGFVVIFINGITGSTLALLSGFMGGWVDTVIMRAVDTMLALPYLMVAIVLAAILGPGKYNIIIILVAMGWAGSARVLRGEVLRVKGSDFISLARVAGCSSIRIMIRHIFPNIFNTLIVLATLGLGSVIIVEAILSFLGVGVPPPHPAWGSMTADGRVFMASAWWISAWPGVAILLVVLSFNLLGDWLRIRLDPKFRQL